MEKISILVPCCNVEKYVRECLDSIKTQTYTNLEVICIDDGSKDRTGEIIDEFVAADERFRVIHKPNSGYGDSMNKGLEVCTGDFIGIIESDDWIEPDMFEVLLKTAKENDLDLARCCWYEGPTGTETENHQDWVDKDIVYCPMDREKVFYQQPSIWASLYRRDLIEEGRKIRFLPTPGASYQDTSFAFKCYTKSKRFMMIDKPYHHYRINPNSSVSSTGKVYCILDEWEEMLRWICGDSTMKNHFQNSALLPGICHGGLIWNYERLSQSTLKLLFLRRASVFFRLAEKEGVLNLKYYSKHHERKTIETIMSSPLDYHRGRISERLNILSKYTDFSVKKEDSSLPLISVVVPCYNTSKYIYSCLTSILQQSYKNIEVICVDDCSTDDTKVQVHHMMRRDKRISWICTEKNSGLSVSRNKGMIHSHGKYITFVDGDDCLLPGAIARLYNAMTDDDDMVAGSAVVSYEGGENQYGNIPESDKKYYTITQDKRFNAWTDIDSALNIHVSGWGKLWRLSMLKENNIVFPEGRLYEDASFYWKSVCIAPRVHVIKEPVYMYQRHLTGSIMSDTFKKKSGMAIDHILILDDIYKFACEKKIEQKVNPILSKLYEPFFWFSFNNSPQSDYTILCENMCRILKEQKVDTSSSSILDYVKHYEETDKGILFMKVFGGAKSEHLDISPAVYRLNKKLKKYRKLTKVFAITSITLLIALIVTLIVL